MATGELYEEKRALSRGVFEEDPGISGDAQKNSNTEPR